MAEHQESKANETIECYFCDSPIPAGNTICDGCGAYTSGEHDPASPGELIWYEWDVRHDALITVRSIRSTASTLLIGAAVLAVLWAIGSVGVGRAIYQTATTARALDCDTSSMSCGESAAPLFYGTLGGLFCFFLGVLLTLTLTLFARIGQGVASALDIDRRTAPTGTGDYWRPTTRATGAGALRGLLAPGDEQGTYDRSFDANPGAASLPVSRLPGDPKTVWCIGCGIEYRATTAFCAECGRRLDT